MSDQSQGLGTTTVLPPAGPGGPPHAGPAGGPPAPRRGVPVWVFVVTIIVVALIVALGAWLALGVQPVSTIPTPEAAVATTTSTVTTTTVTTTTAVATATPAATPTAGADDATKTTTSTSVRQLTLIKSVGGSKAAGYTLKLDFLSDLSGTQAGEAWAKAHGDEWPPPNDYYYVNQSKKVRTYTASKTISITVFSPDGRKKFHPTMALLRSQVLPGSEITYSGAPYYWVTIVDGTTVTKILQVWVP